MILGKSATTYTRWCLRKTACGIHAIAVLMIATVLVFAAGTRGDDFGRIAGPFVSELLRRSDAKSHVSLSVGEIESLSEVLPRVRSAPLGQNRRR